MLQIILNFDFHFFFILLHIYLGVYGERERVFMCTLINYILQFYLYMQFEIYIHTHNFGRLKKKEH